MNTKKPFNQFDCWVEDGPSGNFLLHSKSSRSDGSFEYLCQSFDSATEANFVGMFLASKMHTVLKNNGDEILLEETKWTRQSIPKESK